jgi:hypothetical protein
MEKQRYLGDGDREIKESTEELKMCILRQYTY